MTNYIDGFVLPVPLKYLDQYKETAKKVGDIWKEHGAIAYYEFVGNDLFLEGTKSFVEVIDAKQNEAIVFGWVVFPSKEIRDIANQKISKDKRVSELVSRLTNPKKMIFNASKMVYGGFESLVG